MACEYSRRDCIALGVAGTYPRQNAHLGAEDPHGHGHAQKRPSATVLMSPGATPSHELKVKMPFSAAAQETPAAPHPEPLCADAVALTAHGDKLYAFYREADTAAETKKYAADKKKPQEKPGTLCWSVYDGKANKWTAPQRVKGDVLRIAGAPSAAALRDRIHVVAHNTISEDELFHMEFDPVKTVWSVHTLGGTHTAAVVVSSGLAKDVLGRECIGLVKEQHEVKAMASEKRHVHGSLSPALAASPNRLYACLRDAAGHSLEWLSHDGSAWTVPRPIETDHCRSSASPVLAVA